VFSNDLKIKILRGDDEMWPLVIERNQYGTEKCYDIPSRLLMDRIILLNEVIDSYTATSIIGQLLFLEKQDETAPVTIYINSPGGSISDGFAIYDVMNKVKCPIITICTGMAASMAAFLLSSGTKGKRYALPNSTIMVHQPLGGVQGQATDIAIMANRIISLKHKMYNILAQNTGMEYKDVAQACDRDTYLSPEEAAQLGFIDEIIASTPKAYGSIDENK